MKYPNITPPLFLLRTLYTCILGLVVVVTSGCCGECNLESLGSYIVSPSGRTFVDYTVQGPRNAIFLADTANRSMVLAYSERTSFVQSYVDSCNSSQRCGDCCATYDGEALSISLSQPGGLFSFQINVTPDFNTYPVSGNRPADGGDRLEITANNGLTGVWLLPSSDVITSVSWEGRTFNQVYRMVDNGIDRPGAIVEVLYTRDEGIVGFREVDGTRWVLN